ncbi:hypothetical protein FHR83_004038 [Actinoplanes campanulatus]|uniref:Uncharacterized protein n=1 Tax=Actinoplanes campanulatus TaxID=113559 RepID=A0A7W5FF95_9ACTN|nr:hypothetical protein [Actinoplanes campanulatus]
MGFVDDDRIPALLAQAGDMTLGLERVDGDDRPPEVGERIAVGRQFLADALDSGGVQPDERQCEP